MNYIDVSFELIYGCMLGAEVVPEHFLNEGDDWALVVNLVFISITVVRGHK